MTTLQIFRSIGEWSALYVDGKLHTVGDHYMVEEKAFELAGVEVEESEDFFRGGETRADVAETLEDIAAYRRLIHEKKVAELRQRANALQTEAYELELTYLR